jgi:hypothetical protein
MNTVLTPIHTPPLDTERGAERMTCQLVEVSVHRGQYAFGFERLERWIQMCERAGIRFFEMAHLFTQWGATHTPKIIATVDGTPRRIFGWDVEALSGAYKAFLSAYLPALAKELRLLGVADRCLFHISDEPNASQLEGYLAAKAAACQYLEGFEILDAMSDLAFYQRDPTITPVAASNHIEPFLEANVQGVWAYFCCGQYQDVANQFIAMPSGRSRVLGVQLYRNRVAGFLQWGLNFYNSQVSHYPIDPYATTDGEGAWPAGDPFTLYPGSDGPEDSIRFLMLRKAFEDHRALSLLEASVGRDAALRILDGGDTILRFANCPKDADALVRLRSRVNQAIQHALA